jgi:large subunit ribosomal protein L9
MKIILTETISNLGKTGDIVNVANGYARNFLIPRSIAIVADEKNVTQIRHKKKMMEHRLAKQIEKLKEDAKQVEAVEISIARKAGENGKLFGSVTNQDIHEALTQAGIKVERRDIVISEPIKALGNFKITVKLGAGVEASVKCAVVEEKSTAS